MNDSQRSQLVVGISFVLILFGAGCSGTLRNEMQPATTSYVASSSATDLKNPCAYPAEHFLCELFSRDAKPEWMPVSGDGYAFRVPYSRDWKIGESGMSVYDLEEGSDDPTVVFGRPVDYLNDVLREYRVRRTSVVSSDAPRLESNGCGGAETSEDTVGARHGFLYFDGGAKWCSLIFAFNLGKHTYFVERNLEPYAVMNHLADGAPTSTDVWRTTAALDQEMRQVIESIHER